MNAPASMLSQKVSPLARRIGFENAMWCDKKAKDDQKAKALAEIKQSAAKILGLL